MSYVKILMVVAVLSHCIIDAASYEDSPKNVTSGGRCIGCLIKGIHSMFHRRPTPPPDYTPPSCPPTDLRDVMDHLTTITERINSMSEKVSTITDLRESITEISSKVRDTSVMERLIQNNFERIKETVRREITTVKERVEKVETRVVGISNPEGCGSGGGNTERLERKIDVLAENIAALRELQSENGRGITLALENISRKLEYVSRTVVTLTQTSGGSAVGVGTPGTSCADSPGIIKILDITREIMRELRERQQALSGELQEVKTIVRTVVTQTSSTGVSSQWMNRLPDFNRLSADLQTLKYDIASLKSSISSGFTSVQGHFTSNTERLESLKETVVTSTKQSSSMAASAAASAMRKLASRNLCPKEGI